MRTDFLLMHTCTLLEYDHAILTYLYLNFYLHYSAWLNENEGKKIIVFAHHQSVLNKIEDSIKAIKRIRIDGSTNPKVRLLLDLDE